MKKHPFWIVVDEGWAGISAEITFSHSVFDDEEIEIFLGDEFDDDGEEIEELPIDEALDIYAEAYQNFIENIDDLLKDLQEKAFERYQNLYAHYYENPEKSGNPPLNIDTVEKHNAFIKELIHFRISEEGTIRLSIHYKLDEEHGLEFKFVDNQIETVGGISET